LAKLNPDRVKSMYDRLFAWLKETGARKPTVNPNFNAQAYRQQEIRTRERTLPSLETQAANFLKPGYSPKGWWGSDD
jgi:hypothetical protein